MEPLATYSCCLKTQLAIHVQCTPSTLLCTTLAIHAKLFACRRCQNKQRDSRRHVTIRSIDWQLAHFVLESLLHARFDFNMESRTYDDCLNSHCDLPHRSLSESIREKDISGERVRQPTVGNRIAYCTPF
jgi:hypothetical protein